MQLERDKLAEKYPHSLATLQKWQSDSFPQKRLEGVRKVFFGQNHPQETPSITFDHSDLDLEHLDLEQITADVHKLGESCRACQSVIDNVNNIERALQPPAELRDQEEAERFSILAEKLNEQWRNARRQEVRTILSEAVAGSYDEQALDKIGQVVNHAREALDHRNPSYEVLLQLDYIFHACKGDASRGDATLEKQFDEQWCSAHRREVHTILLKAAEGSSYDEEAFNRTKQAVDHARKAIDHWHAREAVTQFLDQYLDYQFNGYNFSDIDPDSWVREDSGGRIDIPGRMDPESGGIIVSPGHTTPRDQFRADTIEATRGLTIPEAYGEWTRRIDQQLPGHAREVETQEMNWHLCNRFREQTTVATRGMTRNEMRDEWMRRIDQQLPGHAREVERQFVDNI